LQNGGGGEEEEGRGSEHGRAKVARAVKADGIGAEATAAEAATKQRQQQRQQQQQPAAPSLLARQKEMLPALLGRNPLKQLQQLCADR
jgi:hypothetical protein